MWLMAALIIAAIIHVARRPTSSSTHADKYVVEYHVIHTNDWRYK